ncbi:hypothetical protein [Rhodospira trueperi]|uniref:hypothetical protein n=1 Tax=Rhodospira trueperi TaxID=69960 RepID=UPI00115F8C64|nr:hypothetical protein [Rhodospira trueperi]
MNSIFLNFSIGVIGSLIATALAALAIVFFRKTFSAEQYILKQKGKIEEIQMYSSDINLLYAATLRDLVIMNVLFFADSALWNIGEVLMFSSDLQRYVMLIDNLGMFSIRLTTVVILIVGLFISVAAINRINRVLAYRAYIKGEAPPASPPTSS